MLVPRPREDAGPFHDQPLAILHHGIGDVVTRRFPVGFGVDHPIYQAECRTSMLLYECPRSTSTSVALPSAQAGNPRIQSRGSCDLLSVLSACPSRVVLLAGVDPRPTVPPPSTLESMRKATDASQTPPAFVWSETHLYCWVSELLHRLQVIKHASADLLYRTIDVDAFVCSKTHLVTNLTILRICCSVTPIGK